MVLTGALIAFLTDLWVRDVLFSFFLFICDESVGLLQVVVWNWTIRPKHAVINA
jgi:hypothetical protein